MKKKVTKELWVLNLSKKNVSISDIGVRIPPGKAVNIYKFNPYITEYQLEESRSKGALAQKIYAGEVRIIAKQVNPIPPTLNSIKESDSAIKGRKTKSSVVIDAPHESVGEGEDFEFADYGINELGPVTHGKQDDGTVVVNAKQDEDSEPDKGVELKPELESGISQQSQIVMKQAQDGMVDPNGPIAKESRSTVSKPFTVVPPPEPEQKEAVTAETGNAVGKDESGAVVVDGKTSGNRSIKCVAEAQGEADADDVVDADAIIEFEDTPFDSKAATKTEDGSIVMKIKEESDTDENKKVVQKKPRPSKEK